MKSNMLQHSTHLPSVFMTTCKKYGDDHHHHDYAQYSPMRQRVYKLFMCLSILTLYQSVYWASFPKSSKKKYREHVMELPGVIIASKPQRKTPWLCLIFPVLLFYDPQLPKEMNICPCLFSWKTATTIHVDRYRVFYIRYYSETILEKSDIGGCCRDYCAY